MECSICYEQFIQLPSNERSKELEEEFDKNHNDDYDYKWFRYCALLLYPNAMPRYKCHNDKCCKYMCDYCYENTINEKELFKCHYCKTIDYKTYMKKNVLLKLQIKVLGSDGFMDLLMEQVTLHLGEVDPTLGI